MDKCEWKDGIFIPCEVNEDRDALRAAILRPQYMAWFCPFCGADIRKPEPPEPLIVKSGDTWVAHWDGVDYLWTARKLPEDPTLSFKLGSGPWKPFSEIELTDEIAKLRPVCCFSEGLRKYKGKLLHVRQVVNKFLSERIEMGYIGECRIATAEEIQNG